MTLDFGIIEEKWQKAWDEYKIFEADPRKDVKKIFATFPYPYMNGPLHVGHGFTSTRIDVYARFKRMMGFNVLFPWAWHWTGETIAGASERVKHNDRDLIKAFRDIDGVPEELIRKFVDPVFMATYYTQEGKIVVKRMGFSIDWRREFHTTSHDPCFSRFVEWQYLKLMEKNYIIKGSHPVVWCPKCESPTGEADRLVGEDVAPEDYVLIKFKFNSKILLGATLRPETIYGATNLWINPDSEYVVLGVEDEEWIVSTQAAEKLAHQLENTRVVGKVSATDLIGKTCINPVNKEKIFILPGWFVESDVGSGIVYSVPAHAPFDWVALKDLKSEPEILRKYGIDPNIIDGIKPISLIYLEGFGNFPAKEIVDELKIENQNDPRLDEATKVIYRKEFHGGVLKDNCNEYAGKTVRDVKEVMIKDFREKNVASLMYELPSQVVCRCACSCIVKVLRNQWFLNYSDKIWKDKAHSCIARAKIYPENVRQWFNDIIYWFR
ncbi:MAG: class I tRNA ligase family protein [Candidatus Bathyarchaeota archaeon]|nr:MAG: class I tRNA ligase family protein [Candidatus Bathyarchaeota archaeon]